MMQPPNATLRLRVDSDALANNWKALDRISHGASTGAAVKANCYGLGVDRCVPVLKKAGCQSFFVAHWTEAAGLLNHVPANQIAVLHGPINDEEVAYAKATGVVPVINSLSQARRWIEGGGETCHLMVDTGINRLGLSGDELSDPIIDCLNVDILMSHLSTADEDCSTNALQLDAFRKCLPLVPHNRASLANSAGIALGADYSFDLTRPGISLYGGVPRIELEHVIQQVAHLEVAVMQIRKLSRGAKVGYNGEFTAQTDMTVGTVSLGYADGFLRSLGPGNALIVEGQRLPVLGKVSMDMIVVDLSDAPHIKEGSWLGAPFELMHAAQQSSLSQYELLTVLGSRWH